MNWKDQKVIVTGGRGFIGTNLVNDLKSKGANVLIYDLKIGKNLPSSDVRYSINFSRFDPHYIFHLAADVGGIQYLLNNQDQVFYNNAKMLVNVLDAAKQCRNLKGFLFPSSACVYPRKGGKYLKEEDAIPANPHSSYGWSKLYGEMLVKSANIPSTIVRMFNVYGPHDFVHEDAHVIPSLIMKVIKAKDGDTIIVYGSGKQCRAFVCVDDIIEGLEKAICIIPTMSTTFTSIINLGTPVEISMRELVTKIIQISGKELKVFYDKSKPEGEQHRSANIDLAKKWLGWEPLIKLNEGLYKTYKWALENVK